MNLAWRIYRRLARAFPHEFQLMYGADLMQLGDDVLRDLARRGGAAGLVPLLADLAMRLPLEYLSELRGDVRYALRRLIQSRGFALVGILSMGLGIGLTTTVYSSKWQLISRDLPGAAHARRLVMPDKAVSYYDVEHYRAEHALFAGVAAFQIRIPFNVTLPGDASGKPQRVFGQLVSSDYFSVLGVRPQRGRLLDAAPDRPGDPPVVVITDRFWRNRLNAASDVLGRTVRLNGHPATIVGITPTDFNGALAIPPAELFVPITAPAALAPELGNDVLHQRHAKEFLAMICLAPGASIESAEAGLEAITRHLDAQDTSLPAHRDKGRRMTLVPAGTMVPIPRTVRPVIAGFFVVLIALIMAIACMNLANMLLARGANRRKEIAIRLSVGASRSRLVRQMMSEGILLSLLGGTAGFALAYWLSVLNSQVNPASGEQTDLTLDWGAAVFAFALAILCGIGFSLAPALHATKADVAPALKQGSALQLPGYRRFGLRNVLMVVQVAGSLMLLLITGFLVLGISQVSSVQTRFDPHTMYLLSLDPVRDGYAPEKAQALFEQLPRRLKATGGARSIALAAQTPFSTGDERTLLTVEDSRQSARMQKAVARETVGAGYFAALSEPMLAGREFDELDQRSPTGGSLPVVLNESAARGLFGNRSAIGGRLRDDLQSYEVVGVVRDLRNHIATRQSIVYLPLTRRDFARPPRGGMTIMVRSNHGLDALSVIRNEIAAIDPDLTIFNVQTLRECLDDSQSETRLAIRVYGGVGVFGLVLSAIGLGGVTAYAVAQRRKEIGIRTALGATKAQVLRLVLREGTALVGLGTVLGFLGAIAVARMLSAITSVLVEALKVGTNDPRLLVGAPLLLASLAILACYVPARRAARLDPLKAIREE